MEAPEQEEDNKGSMEEGEEGEGSLHRAGP
jgi:hypothetical protein